MAMNKFIIETEHKTRIKEIEVEVSYLPFPSEKARDEAYDTHVKLFLKAKEREFMERIKDKKVNNYSQKGNSCDS